MKSGRKPKKKKKKGIEDVSMEAIKKRSDVLTAEF